MISQKNKIVDKSQQNCRATNLFDQDTECKDILHTHTQCEILCKMKRQLCEVKRAYLWRGKNKKKRKKSKWFWEIGSQAPLDFFTFLHPANSCQIKLPDLAPQHLYTPRQAMIKISSGPYKQEPGPAKLITHEIRNLYSRKRKLNRR